jgi:RHS repeat-associated protein
MDTKNKIDVSPIGLYFYGSRYFDPLLGRFVSPDTIIPEASQGIQAWDRYAGMNNNPVRWNDPTGHDVGCAGREASDCRCNENLVPGARPPYRSTPTPTPRLEPWEFEPPLPTSIPSFPSIRAPEPGEISVPNIIESPNAQSTTGDYILIFGAGGSAGGFSSYHVSGGEFVIFPTNHSYGLYKYLGTGTISGASINVSLYMGLGINVPNPESYSGSTNSIGITFSLQEVGITVAGFMGENSSSGYVPIGLILGYSPGAGLGCFGTNAMYKLLYSK